MAPPPSSSSNLPHLNISSKYSPLDLSLSSSTSPPPVPLSPPPPQGSPRSQAHERVVVALRSAGATHVLLPDPDPATLRAFLYSGISLLLSLPNFLLPALASNRSTARRWLSEHVLPFHPRAHVAAISAGHAVLSSSSSPGLVSSLLPAIQNLCSACLHRCRLPLPRPSSIFSGGPSPSQPLSPPLSLYPRSFY